MSLASLKSRLVLPVWYRLTQVVPDKGRLNGCVCCVDKQFPVGRIHRHLKTRTTSHGCVGAAVAVYSLQFNAAILEYLTAEVTLTLHCSSCVGLLLTVLD